MSFNCAIYGGSLMNIRIIIATAKMIFLSDLLFCRHYQPVLRHVVYGRDVHQDVCGRLSGILWLNVQPF